jgi:hypothetical protein
MLIVTKQVVIFLNRVDVLKILYTMNFSACGFRERERHYRYCRPNMEKNQPY